MGHGRESHEVTTHYSTSIMDVSVISSFLQVGRGLCLARDQAKEAVKGKTVNWFLRLKILE